jgi:transcriptional regulator with XRE-family HTH domain
MIEQLTLPGGVDPEAGPTGSGGRAFTQWLQLQLRARKLTQRQLAQKSGVDHSTISRLMRGDRTPSLRTATLLARGLGFPHGRSDSPTARVEYALRSDGLLTEPAVGRIMKVYLAARLRPPSSVATPVHVEAAGTTRVPILVRVAGVRPRSTVIGRPPPQGVRTAPDDVVVTEIVATGATGAKCLNGGWKTMHDDLGTIFKNQVDSVRCHATVDKAPQGRPGTAWDGRRAKQALNTSTS